MADFTKPIGSLWKKQSKTGTIFYSGNITVNGVKIDIVVFTNRKRPDKQDPDLRIFENEMHKRTAEDDPWDGK